MQLFNLFSDIATTKTAAYWAMSSVGGGGGGGGGGAFPPPWSPPWKLDILWCGPCTVFVTKTIATNSELMTHYHHGGTGMCSDMHCPCMHVHVGSSKRD